MTRLYHSDDIHENQVLTLTVTQNHYLRHVLRANQGYRLAVFNERDGEWSAILSSLSKTNSSVTVEEQIRPAVASLDISLIFAPLKHDPLTFLVEKATELGVRHFHPVLTERCIVTRLNHDRMKANMIEAAQQSERFDIPTLSPLVPLGAVLTTWNPRVPLLVCQERGEVPMIAEALRPMLTKGEIGFFIGPEGGLSSQEINYLKSFSFTQFINLGPRILRAETAALAAVACYQAFLGDWGKR